DRHAVRELEDLKRKWHVGDARHAREVTLCFRIRSGTVLIVLLLLGESPRLIRNRVALHDTLARGLAAPGRQPGEPLPGMVLNVPGRRVDDLPDALQIRLPGSRPRRRVSSRGERRLTRDRRRCRRCDQQYFRTGDRDQPFPHERLYFSTFPLTFPLSPLSL